MMNEEQVTKSILRWLQNSDWEIICFDFPQSGTGRFLHPNGSREKNKDAINPDIVAIKGSDCVFFENKDHFYFKDYQKQHRLIVDNQYTDAIGRLLSKYTVINIFYGIGLPTLKHTLRSIKAQPLVDFIIGVNEDNTIMILYSATDYIRTLLQ